MTNDIWSRQAWQEALPVYEKILQQPFIKELADGSLAKDRFEYYIEQDSLYIADYFRVLANIASRLDDNGHAASFITFAADGVAVEKALHGVYLGGRSLDDVPKGAGCLLYTSWLKSHCNEPVEVAAAAILPCFWVYQQVGRTIYDMQKNGVNNPYKEWIDCYADPAFEVSNARAIEICDQLAQRTTPATRHKMTRAFVVATQMEYDFWACAYDKK